MVLPCSPSLVSPPAATFVELRGRAAKVNLSCLPCVWLPEPPHVTPPAARPLPYTPLLPHLSRSAPHDRTLDRYHCQLCASGVGARDHPAAAWAMAEGSGQWLERRRLIIQPILPPQTTGTTCHDPYLALAHHLPHAAPSRLSTTMSSRGAAALRTLSLPVARSKPAVSSIQLRRALGRKKRTH